MQGLATALGVPADQARGWHAVAVLEHVLGQQLQPSRPMGVDSVDAAAIDHAVLELSTCQHQDMRLHAAELLVALKRPRLALQQAQRCCHSIVSTLTATQVAVPVWRAMRASGLYPRSLLSLIVHDIISVASADVLAGAMPADQLVPGPGRSIGCA